MDREAVVRQYRTPLGSVENYWLVPTSWSSKAAAPTSSSLRGPTRSPSPPIVISVPASMHPWMSMIQSS